MSETEPSYPEETSSLREILSRDGHFTENVTSLIAHQASRVRLVYPSLIDATFRLMDALGGKKNRIPQEVVDRITTLSVILDNSALAADAQNAGLMCSPNQIKVLDEASRKSGGIAKLREIALRLTLPSAPGQHPVSLSDRIKAFPPQK